MALIHLIHAAETLKMDSSLYVILPDPGRMGERPVSARKVLYLLHGLSDDASAWQRYTSIETVARDYGLVVVMPSFGRSFYTDQPNGQAYFTYLVEELPRYLKDVFGIIPKRDDTLIAGLSMGGYGAFKAAFLHPEMYSAAASFSGVLSMDILAMKSDDSFHSEIGFLFGDLASLPGSEHDPAIWVQQAVAKKMNLPRLYITCGRQDELYSLNVQFRSLCEKFKLNVNYHEEDGKHDWYFWDSQIRYFLGEILGPLS